MICFLRPHLLCFSHSSRWLAQGREKETERAGWESAPLSAKAPVFLWQSRQRWDDREGSTTRWSGMEGWKAKRINHTQTRTYTHMGMNNPWWWLSASVWQTGRWEACWWRGLERSFVILICSHHWHPSLLGYCLNVYDLFMCTIMHRLGHKKEVNMVWKEICSDLMIHCNPRTYSDDPKCYTVQTKSTLVKLWHKRNLLDK